MNLKYSIIIPCNNEESFIENLLKDLSKQTIGVKSYEIIIVDNASNDKTAQIIWDFIYNKSSLKIKIIHELKLGVSIARNSGAKIASGEILVFLDADNRVSENFLQNIENKTTKKTIGGSFKTIPYDGNYLISFIFIILEIIKRYGFKPFGKSFINKEIFYKIGKFNENIVLGENVEIFLKLKKYCKKNKKKIIHIKETIYCSSRRFQMVNPHIILRSWFFAYLGNWKLKYKTMREINNYNKSE